MSTKRGQNVLSQTRSVKFHEDDGTFSFVLKSGKKIRLELNKAGIEYIGGTDELRRFVEQIESRKLKVNVDKATFERLRSSAIFSDILLDRIT